MSATTTGQRIYFPAIDGLRFLAFLFVFFRHFTAYQPIPFLYETGWIGVELFFLISAFLLTRLLKAEYQNKGSVNNSNFFTRRILRIWPLYFAYLLFTVFFWLIKDINHFSTGRLAGNIFFIDNILSAIDYYNNNPFSFHLWSISLEEQFYLVLPFAIPWLLRQPQKNILFLFVIIFILMLAARYLSVAGGAKHPFIYVLPVSGDCFLAGILLGLGYFDDLLKKMNGYFCLAASACILAVLYFFPSKSDTGIHQVFVYTFVAIAFVLLFTAVVYSKASVVTQLMNNRFIRYLGKISYGLYIFHIFGIYEAAVFCEKMKIIAPEWQLPIALSITLGLSIISYELFEKYFLRKKKKFTSIESTPV